MAYAEVPRFVARLREQDSVGAAALEFLILTASRSNETLGALWSEIDFAEKLWIVSPARMKSGKPHRVPLSPRAVEILDGLDKVKAGPFVFPGRRFTKPPSHVAMGAVLRRMGVRDATVHGFRSSFRDWAGDATTHPRETAEAALSHAVGDETERAYPRSDSLAARRALMDAWDAYLSPGESGK